MITEAFVLSILVGFLRRGRLGNLGRVPLRHFYLFVLPLVVFTGAYLASRTTADGSLLPYVRAANILQYVVLLAAIGLNLHLRGMWLAGVGTLLNFLAVAANGGMMPVSKRALEAARLTELLNAQHGFIRHAIMTPETHLKPLGDIIPVPGFAFILPQVASIGDVLVAVAVFVLVQWYMCSAARDVEEGSASD